MKNAYIVEDMHFSTLFGRGIYQPDMKLVSNPLLREDASPASPLLVNVLSGERFFLKVLNCKPSEVERFEEQVLHPAPRKDVCWPSDIIALDEALSTDTKIFVSHLYDVGDEKVSQSDRYALLFQYDGMPDVITWDATIRHIASDDYFDQNTDKGRNWLNPNIRDLAISLVQALNRINESGYWYFDLHPERILVSDDETKRVYLDYSNLIYSQSNLSLERKNSVTSPDAGWYPVEFAEPAYVRGTHEVFDIETQNYSLTAFLFHLFYGRYAYDGEAMSGRLDYSEDSHYLWFRDYYKHPIFIFEPDNTNNGIHEDNPDDKEQQLIDLWYNSPKKLRELFISTLRRENAERQTSSGQPISVHNPTPSDWLNLFMEFGWYQKGRHERRAY